MPNNQYTSNSTFATNSSSKPPKFTCLKELGQALTNNNYKFTITWERCNYNNKNYILITRLREGCHDKSIGIPVQYAGAIGSLLIQAYLEYKCISDGGKAPTKIENLK